MTITEAVFAIQRLRYLVEEYVRMIEAFGLDEEKVYDRAGVRMAVRDEQIVPSLEDTWQNKRREQEEPIAG